MFKDRYEAGKKLAQKLKKYKDMKDVVVLAVPRGGVVVGWEIAKALNVTMDIIITRKIGAPHNPELAVGAVMPDGKVLLNKELVSALGITQKYIEKAKQEQFKEIKRRLVKYKTNTRQIELKDKQVILVDDGIATGFTVKAALEYIHGKNTARKILAVPVMPRDVYEDFKKEVDELITLLTPEVFYAVGQFYNDFEQVNDKEVIKIMETRHKTIKENR